MSETIHEAELEAYLDEALPVAHMATIEDALRQRPELLEQLKAINARRDAGIHSLGEVWRRGRLSCGTREQLGSYLLGVLPEAETEYLDFHLEVVGCRYCQANLIDLKLQQASGTGETNTRRRRYFKSTAGYLRQS